MDKHKELIEQLQGMVNSERFKEAIDDMKDNVQLEFTAEMTGEDSRPIATVKMYIEFVDRPASH